MVFSSMIFLWLFLPCVLILNLILPRGAANWFLIAAGFIFYAWDQVVSQQASEEIDHALAVLA